MISNWCKKLSFTRSHCDYLNDLKVRIIKLHKKCFPLITQMDRFSKLSLESRLDWVEKELQCFNGSIFRYKTTRLPSTFPAKFRACLTNRADLWVCSLIQQTIIQVWNIRFEFPYFGWELNKSSMSEDTSNEYFWSSFSLIFSRFCHRLLHLFINEIKRIPATDNPEMKITL